MVQKEMEIEITTRMGTMRAATTAMVPTRIQARMVATMPRGLFRGIPEHPGV